MNKRTTTITTIVLMQITCIAGLIVYIHTFQEKNIYVNSVRPGEKVVHKSLSYYYELPKNEIVEPFVTSAPRKAVYNINKSGFNDKYDYPEQKGEGVLRIIALGDSFTFGLFVDTTDNWTEIAERLLNSTTCGTYEVINLGVYGYDFRYAFERYKKYGDRLNPDLIIWMFADADRINEELFSRIDKSRPITYTNLAQAKNMYMKNWSVSKVANYQSSIFQSFNSEYKKSSVFYTMPWYSKEFMNSIQQINNTFPAFSYSKTIEHIFSDKKFLFENDGHPNTTGHEAIAKIITKEIIQKLPPLCLSE